MKAFILAGGKATINVEGCDNKALLPIEGKVMVQYLIDALKKSVLIDGIAIIGAADQLQKIIEIDPSQDVILQEEGAMIDNVVKGLVHFQDQEKFLMITSDIPFITPAAIDHFIQASLDSKGDLTYPVISKESHVQAFPDMHRTFVKLKDGTFNGGNMILIDPAIKDRFISMARQMFENRKKPWKMVKILGIGFLFRLLLGTLTIESIEKRLADLLNIHPKAIITPYAEIGNDVDKESDVIMAKKYMFQGSKY